MINQKLIDYIKEELKRGVSKDIIKNVLLSKGWQEKDIEESFNLLKQEEQPTSFKRLSSVFSKKLIVIIVSIVSGIVVIGGGIFAYFYFSEKSPEEVIQLMKEKIKEIKTLEYDGEVKYLTTINKKPYESLVNFTGSLDLRDLDNLKTKISINANPQSDPSQSLDLKLIVIGKIAYFKLTKFFDIPFFGFFISSLKNQWIKIDTDEIEKLVNQFKLKKEGGLFGNIEKLSSEQKNQINKLILNTKFFKITEKLPSEKINGINTYHYKFLLEKKEIINLVQEIIKILKEVPLTEKEIEYFNKSSYKGEIWIGKKDFLPYKFNLNFNIKENEKSETELRVLLKLKNYNNSFKIEAPSSAKSLIELMPGLFGGFFAGFLQQLQQKQNLNSTSSLPFKFKIKFKQTPSFPSSNLSK